MAFLQQGVVDMLTTRLATPDKVVVAAGDEQYKAVPDQAMVLAKGRQISADYVIYGSLTLLGNSISTDFSVVSTADKRLALTFSRSDKDHSALISHLDQFSAEMKQKVLGLSPVAPRAPMNTRPKPQAPVYDTIHQHPEKLLNKPIEGQGVTTGGLMPIESDTATQRQGTIWGPRIADQIQGVAVGDLTGDGRLESVYVGRNSVWIYRYLNGRFAKMAHIKGTGNYVGVDTADLDGDGLAEIFVTNVDNSDGRLISFVLAFNGQAFERRAERLGFYFRAINLPERGRILLGQRQGFDSFFAPGIFEIEFDGGKYRKGKRVSSFRRQNLFGIGTGKFSEAESQQIVAFTASRYLQLLDAGGKPGWKSAEDYGGSGALIEKRDTGNNNLSKESMQYLSARIEVHDLDKDGIDEVVVMSNNDTIGGSFSKSRIFKSGYVEVLKGAEFGLIPYLRTRKMTKYISDFALADLDGDGKVEIVAAVVRQNGSALSTGKSRICIFNLMDNKKKSEQKQTVQ